MVWPNLAAHIKYEIIVANSSYGFFHINQMALKTLTVMIITFIGWIDNNTILYHVLSRYDMNTFPFRLFNRKLSAFSMYKHFFSTTKTVVIYTTLSIKSFWIKIQKYPQVDCKQNNFFTNYIDWCDHRTSFAQ